MSEDRSHGGRATRLLDSPARPAIDKRVRAPCAGGLFLKECLLDLPIDLAGVVLCAHHFPFIRTDDRARAGGLPSGSGDVASDGLAPSRRRPRDHEAETCLAPGRSLAHEPESTPLISGACAWIADDS